MSIAITPRLMPNATSLRAPIRKSSFVCTVRRGLATPNTIAHGQRHGQEGHPAWTGE